MDPRRALTRCWQLAAAKQHAALTVTMPTGSQPDQMVLWCPLAPAAGTKGRTQARRSLLASRRSPVAGRRSPVAGRRSLLASRIV
ncbi:MAG: hypothetical protein M0Z40_15280 [Actinomycetota bacterium]|nr:hypothetical protein [Actinomycetota bacterium]